MLLLFNVEFKSDLADYSVGSQEDMATPSVRKSKSEFHPGPKEPTGHTMLTWLTPRPAAFATLPRKYPSQHQISQARI